MNNRSSFLLVTLFVVAGCKKAEMPAEQSPRTVLTTTIKDESIINKNRIAGELRAVERAMLSFETNGVIVDIEVELGDGFKKGDVLAKLDQTRAKLNLEARQADLLNVEAELNDAQLNYDRNASLGGTGAVSVASIDRAQARLKSAKARFLSTKSTIATAEQQLSETYLIAPFEGVVVRRFSEPSQVVNIGQPIMEIEGSESGLEAVVSVPDHIRSKLHLKDKNKLTILSSGFIIDTEIIEIGSQSNSAGLFPVTLSLTGETSSASSGQAVEVEFKNINENDSLTEVFIPVTAYVMNANGQTSVYVVKQVNDSTTVHQQPVSLGDFSESKVVVNSGLVAGEVIVSKGVDLLSDGQQVNVLDLNIERFGN